MEPQWPSHDVGATGKTTALHWPFWHWLSAGHTPHEPPQPSAPQSLVAQMAGVGLHASTHWPLTHAGFAGSLQAPQYPPQPSSPQFLPAQFGTQAAQVSLAAHVSLGPQPATGKPKSQSGSWAPQPQSQVSRPAYFAAEHVHAAGALATHLPLASQLSNVLHPAMGFLAFLQSGSGAPQPQLQGSAPAL